MFFKTISARERLTLFIVKTLVWLPWVLTRMKASELATPLGRWRARSE